MPSMPGKMRVILLSSSTFTLNWTDCSMMSVAHPASIWVMGPSSRVVLMVHDAMRPRMRFPSTMNPLPDMSESGRNEVVLPLVANTLSHACRSVTQAPVRSAARAGELSAMPVAQAMMVRKNCLDIRIAFTSVGQLKGGGGMVGSGYG